MAMVALVLDQVSKWWVLSEALPCLAGETGPRCLAQSPSIEVLPFFNLTMAWNRGVSFGMFAHEADFMPFVLAGLSLAISAALLAWLRGTDRLGTALCLGAVIGGAVGNTIDRFRFGAVADFLDFHAWGWHWYTFNVADSCIVVGVMLLVVEGLFGRPGPTARR